MLPEPDSLIWYTATLTLTDQIGKVSSRRVALVEGPSGWGEAAPLVGVGDHSPFAVLARRRSLGAAIEAAFGAWPTAVRSRVEVNATVGAIAPEDVEGYVEAHDLCRYNAVKVKGGDSQTVDRVAAMRSALGSEVAIRVDANCAWDVGTAVAEIGRMRAYDVDYIEDPVGSISELVSLRSRYPGSVRIAVDQPVWEVRQARSLPKSAADVLIVKVQTMGGFGAAARVIEAAGRPIVVTSALGSSVGLAMDVAFACSDLDLWGPCGLATSELLRSDLTEDTFDPHGIFIEPRKVVPDLARLTPAVRDDLRTLGVIA